VYLALALTSTAAATPHVPCLGVLGSASQRAIFDDAFESILAPIARDLGVPRCLQAA
jgi:hypothetical protein